MQAIKTYKTNRLPALVVVVLTISVLFSIDIERLIIFYQDPWHLFIVLYIVLINPALLFFGFAFRLEKNLIVCRHYLFLKKIFEISDLSHILYQPTWRGITSINSQTNMRSLHIVRHAGGWSDTISLSNAAYKEEDLADIAKRLQKINQRIELDEHAQALIKKYEPSS
jgi:hypothetical protein